MPDLADFDGGVQPEKPLVERRSVVWSPTSPDKPAGFVGRDRVNDRRVYTTRRTSYHYYEEGGGWAISESILSHIADVDVSHIYVHEKDSGDVHVFLRRHYDARGERVPDGYLVDEDDPQVYIGDSNARESFSGYAERLFQRPFNDAMDYCLNKGRTWSGGR
jgi:hypothetical protein